MYPLPMFFDDFLKAIRPTTAQNADYRKGHQLLRKRLLSDDALKALIVATFLQGSYRRVTANRPDGDARPDIDVVVVTEIPPDVAPADAMALFEPFLQRHYPGKWSRNARSFSIELARVSLDLVITSKADAEARTWVTLLAGDTEDEVGRWDSLFEGKGDAWKNHPIWIPDRRLNGWQRTHPLAQIQATWELNRGCNGHYLGVVRGIKWWRGNHPKPKYPRSYPLEHLVGECCPAGITSVAEGVVRTFEEVRDRYAACAQAGEVPVLCDHGVDQNVMERVTGGDFAGFHRLVCDAAKTARDAIEADSKTQATTLWRDLFGPRFPIAKRDDEDFSDGFTERRGRTVVGGARYG